MWLGRLFDLVLGHTVRFGHRRDHSRFHRIVFGRVDPAPIVGVVHVSDFNGIAHALISAPRVLRDGAHLCHFGDVMA